MALKSSNKFRTWESCGKHHLQVPDPIFGKSNNSKLEAKLFGLGRADYLMMVRDKYGAKLVNYGSFIGFHFDSKSKINKLKNELNKRLEKALA